jgi:hypothetical protein
MDDAIFGEFAHLAQALDLCFCRPVAKPDVFLTDPQNRAQQRRARRPFIEPLKLERSFQYRYLEVSIMFIRGPLDVLHQILAPYRSA